MIHFYYRGSRTLRAAIADFLCLLAILGLCWFVLWVFTLPMK